MHHVDHKADKNGYGGDGVRPQGQFVAHHSYEINNLIDVHQLKLLISEPISRCHPSTMRKSSSLSGVEITTGGSCNMPTEVVMEATTMSTIRKGRKRTVPIW